MYRLIEQGNRTTLQEARLNYVPSEVQGECLLREVTSVRLNRLKLGLFCLSSLLLVGLPLLLVHWYPHFLQVFLFESSPLQHSTHVAILNYDQQPTIASLKSAEVSRDELKSVRIRLFRNRYLNYWVDEDRRVTVQLFDSAARMARVVRGDRQGLSDNQVEKLRESYGKGTMEIDQVQWYEILGKELLRPLYLFLFFSTSLWIYEEYEVYSFIVLGTCCLAIAATVVQLLSLNHKIHTMAYHHLDFPVLRNAEIQTISSLDLVPGDIVFLRKPLKFPFEGALIEGNALINECSLTGESVPVVKNAAPLEDYFEGRPIEKGALVYEGTTVIQGSWAKKTLLFPDNEGVPVLVTRTNFLTTKGQLIRIILFPKQQENVFQRQSGKFLLLMFLIALVTFLCMIPQLLATDSLKDIVVSFLDLVAITVPAALPVSMALGIIYSIQKLKEKSIFCIEQQKVIAGGDVSFCCFDKTGTLTEDYMDFQALVPASSGQFKQPIKNRPEHLFNLEQALAADESLFHCFSNMASNHSIVQIEDTGQLVGDPMEIKLLTFGQFTLTHPENSDVLFGYRSLGMQEGSVIRRFDFDSDLQRMSVIAEVKSQGRSFLVVYSKGSPQVMSSIMQSASIPSDYSSVLKDYTSNGYRVLAIARKCLQVSAISLLTRQEVESNLLFNGFEVFQNKLKVQTKGAISALKQAQMGVLMITGDDPFTGANIGYECGIAFRSKGMFICDYLEDTFTSEEFIYHDRQHDRAADILAEIEEERNSNYQPLIDFDLHRRDLQDGIELVQSNGNEIFREESGEEYMKRMVSLARKKNSQLCVTGRAFSHLFEGQVEEISQVTKSFLNCTTVFARTKPNDKAKIVRVYQHTGKTVSMCGDGANDCGALKQADIGLSLSPAEASVSAPFTSQITNISSMVQLVKQCRAGLSTNFSLFNIMATYTLTQYVTTSICQFYYAYPPQLQYMFWDLACNFFFIVLVGYTPTGHKLSVQRPSRSLFCLSNLFQVLFAFSVVVAGQLYMIIALRTLFSETIDYFAVGGSLVNLAKLREKGERSGDTPQTSILFLFSNFMVLFTLLTFNLGQPWRLPFYTNRLFVALFVVILTYCILIVLIPAVRLNEFYLTYMDDPALKLFILGSALGCGLLIFLTQKYIWLPLFDFLKRRYPHKTWI